MSGTATLPDGRLVDSLKVVELKKELEVLGLDKNGLKKDLVRRLSAALTDSVNIQPSSEVGFGGKVPDETVSGETGSEKDSPSKLGGNSDQPLESDAAQDPPSKPDLNSKASVESVGTVSESKDSRATQEKLEPQSLTEAAAPQSVIKNSQLVQEHTRESSPPVVEVSVELHEEEEDYGDEEEEEEAANARKKEEADMPVTLVDTDPKTCPPKSGGSESSTFRKPASPPPPNASVPAFVRKETRAVGFTVESPERVNPAAEARCSPSNLVYIRCLVRPFTAAQLATMLETHFGRASELWLDRIKSTAVARFSNEEVAAKCREGLDGCRWPSINPRILQCEFASEALLVWLKEHGEAGDKPPPRHLFGGGGTANAASSTENNGISVERKRSEKSMDDTEITGGVKRRRMVGGEGVTKPTEKEGEGRSKRDTRGEESSKTLDDLFKKTAATPSVYWLPLTDEAAAAQLKARKQTYLAESTRRPVPKRNVEERRRENRSPFTGEFGNGPTSSASNPLLPPDASARERRQRERTPSPGNKRTLRERRRSPSPRRPRYTNRTPSPRFGGSSFAASNAAAATNAADSRHPPPPSPSPNYRRRTPLRR